MKRQRVQGGKEKREEKREKGWKEVNDQGRPENRLDRASRYRVLSGSSLCILRLPRVSKRERSSERFHASRNGAEREAGRVRSLNELEAVGLIARRRRREKVAARGQR